MNSFYFIFQIALVIGFPIIFILLYFKTLNQNVSAILNTLPENPKAIFKDTRIWFKGFDMLKKRNTFRMNPLKPLYSFNVADLYIQNDKIIVVGKMRILGKTQLLQPFAICWIGREPEKPMPKILTRGIRTAVVGDDIEIEFEDYEYKNPIKLVVKKIGKEVYQQIEVS